MIILQIIDYSEQLTGRLDDRKTRSSVPNASPGCTKSAQDLLKFPNYQLTWLYPKYKYFPSSIFRYPTPGMVGFAPKWVR